MSRQNPFFTLYSGLDREGPGEPADVAWALAETGLNGAIRVCDAGAGSGADAETLAQLLPEARIEAVEKAPSLAREAAARLAPLGARVTAREGDMAALGGPFDLIWCAGAIYFLGVTEGLRAFSDALAPGGWVAFSEPVLLDGGPDDPARAFWAEYPAITDLDGLWSRVEAAGFAALGHRIIRGAPWEAYYTSLEARIAALEPQAKGDLADVIADTRAEIAAWRAARDHVAYALILARPT